MNYRVVGTDIHVGIAGEIDLKSAAALRDSLDSLIDQHSEARRMVVSLRSVSFMDSSGMGVLLGRHKRLASRGGSLVVIEPSPSVRRALTAAGFATLIPVLGSGADITPSAVGRKDNAR